MHRISTYSQRLMRATTKGQREGHTEGMKMKGIIKLYQRMDKIGGEKERNGSIMIQRYGDKKKKKSDRLNR